MKEKLIEFNTAKLLKEKGFDIRTDNVFLQYIFVDITSRDNINYDSCKDLKGVYFQPSQSLAQKWIREVHEIHIEIRNYIEYKYKIIYLTPTFNKRGTQILSVTGSKYYNNYEDCMEQALIESLTLIK